MSPHSEKDRIRASELLHQVFESLAGSRRFASHGAGLSTQLWPLLANGVEKAGHLGRRVHNGRVLDSKLAGIPHSAEWLPTRMDRF